MKLRNDGSIQGITWVPRKNTRPMAIGARQSGLDTYFSVEPPNDFWAQFERAVHALAEHEGWQPPEDLRPFGEKLLQRYGLKLNTFFYQVPEKV